MKTSQTPYKLVSSPDAQKGVGLIEVLVSLVLLAIAALGYAALQAQSIGSTDESLTRTHAITILRTTAEKMRTNGLGVSYTIAQTPDPAAPVGTPPPDDKVYAALDYYQELLNQDSLPTKIDKCLEKGEGCSLLEITQNDVYEIKTEAKRLGVDVGMVVCPGTASSDASKCIIASWNKTKPTIGSNATTNCMDDKGVYHFFADCVYMEAY